VSCVADANIDAISGAKVTGTVANATNAATAASVSGVVPIANGGTGSATKNFVDLSTAQTIAGNKTFSGTVTIGSLNASLGQSASTVFGTSSITITPSAALTVIPGLTQTVNVPTGYKAYLVAGGGLSTISGSTTGFSVVDIAFVIDGMVTPEGNYRRVIAANTTGIVNVVAYWNISSTISLTPGSHNIEVRAAGVGSGFNATVSGDSNSILQSDLTVILIKN
jgi:hypothetical protein